ncbi:hypothetical protein ACH79_43485 [Bradyrhizobium sp. CCBAU 051011]|uniref:hypothetical protein n=1 Tax=Bradyrhizobium sp. CCBAU 051011 TaxID=858422 RepID=UPI00137416F6|nr:hypothetical protein [Bradyrhizobium sp. CCBAU 051011]QHO78439.1 hypothetical protein ACH79_43485 [Bradyrhizobium sp. CCBAU 051011]
MEVGGANWIAHLAIVGWPLVALVLYKTRPPVEATAWTVLGAFLFLPIQAFLKVPMIPAIDKGSVGSLAAILGSLLFFPRDRRFAKLGVAIGALIAVYICSPVVTSILNGDLIVAGPRIIPGVDYYDGISALLSQLILFFPFLVGLRFLSRPEDIETLLRALVVAALAYSLLMLLEVRLSPQLATWIYGVVTPFAVEMRYGGFRPVVFTNNGLVAAFFLATAVIASVALWRTKIAIGKLPPAGISIYLGGVLVLCKSAGALIYAMAIGALARWFSPRAQMRVAVLLASIALSYPLLRINDLVPVSPIYQVAAAFNQERADSLKFRFDQEDQLLAHGAKRFWFGWGRYGRNRVYDEYGKDLSITDGQWILAFGQFGFVGFVAQFGLLTWPVFKAARSLRFLRSRREIALLSCLSLIVAVTAVEQIPNASINPWGWLLAGALLGRSMTASKMAARGQGVEARNAVAVPERLFAPSAFKTQ